MYPIRGIHYIPSWFQSSQHTTSEHHFPRPVLSLIVSTTTFTQSINLNMNFELKIMLIP